MPRQSHDAAAPSSLLTLESASPVGRFHAWWRGDPLPLLPHLPGLVIGPADDVLQIARLADRGLIETQQRIAQGHRPWLATLQGEPVAWGWCATKELSIGELDISRPLPPGNRYLWDFCTVPTWRGHGIYPRLLQAIVASGPDVDRFWVGHDLPNTASARGIAKAGFQEVGLLYQRPHSGFVLIPSGPLPRAAAAGELFGVAVEDRHSARSA